MDPFSIISGSFGLAGAIAKVSVIIVEFTRDARDATTDLDALSAELQTLSTVLNPLARSISGPTAATVPASLLAQVATTLGGCNTVVEQIEENIQKYRRNGVFSKAGWAMFGQTDTNKLRTSLEYYNTALSLGIHAISLSLGQSVKEDTSAIRHDTAAIKLNTDEILARVNSIRRTALEPQANNSQRRVEQWIEDMAELSSYAETTYQGTVVAPTEVGVHLDAFPQQGEEVRMAVRTREQDGVGAAQTEPKSRPLPQRPGETNLPERGTKESYGQADIIPKRRPSGLGSGLLAIADSQPSVSMRATSLAHARRQSIQARRAQREAEARAEAENSRGAMNGDNGKSGGDAITVSSNAGEASASPPGKVPWACSEGEDPCATSTARGRGNRGAHCRRGH
ncbi:hypothetical protein B0T16DRAFT_115113 [Cercophora newfieldiana]|uniref:Azaphilone pigments biosynthesis cluster protein L N-terminal domain-containing protein n=1 Tax=Cercophora newfieldiana TaxID=92897 RepID=A0AA39Y9A9_9PEZI|nr:hypothetical protein B0T16DRAFT_115113 [Cercophora newfieldiana]